jgi:hypothetical protein
MTIIELFDDFEAQNTQRDYHPKTLSEFVLGTAISAAEQTLTDRRIFQLNSEQWAEFIEKLDAPPHRHPRLEQLLQEPNVFDCGTEALNRYLTRFFEPGQKVILADCRFSAIKPSAEKVCIVMSGSDGIFGRHKYSATRLLIR